jgi:LDH2 family malate/lactate/ureidoglycolate dehydrogenase
MASGEFPEARGLLPVSDPIRARPENLRRFATELISGLGVSPARGAALASHLLWFDAAGAATFGIATLPRWLERIDGREFDLAAEGKVMTERNGTAVLDGQNGLPPLILERAAGLAVEKAREAGVGLVRVARLGPTGPAAVVAAEIAIGPMSATIVGPGPSWSLAMPSDRGLPAVYDSALLGAGVRLPYVDGPGPWAAVLTPEDGWLIAAVAVAAWEPLPAFHARVKAALEDQERKTGPLPGQLLPLAWEAHRRDIREHGVPIPDAVRTALRPWAERLGVAPLAPEPH